MIYMDLQFFNILHSLAGQSSFLDSVIVFCAEYLAYILIAIFLGLLFWSRMAWQKKRELFAVALASTVLSRGIITELIRHFYHHPRPFAALDFQPLIQDSAWSFPSGHATFFFALSTAIYLYDRKWGIGFFLVTVVITLARVAAGVHYPSVIVGGAIIGLFAGYFAYFCMQRYVAKNTHQTY